MDMSGLGGLESGCVAVLCNVVLVVLGVVLLSCCVCLCVGIVL